MFRALQVAIEANNLGVALLKHDSPTPALDIFRSAADLMYSLTQDLKRKLVEEEEGNNINSSPLSCQLKTPMVQEKIDRMIREHKQDHGDDDKMMFGERNDFLYSHGLELTLPSVPSNFALESASVLFNMGLAYHLSCTCYSQDCLEIHNALNLYDMAASVAFRLENQETCQPNKKKSSLVVMASLNNMGQIYHELGSYNVAREYLDDLSQYITALNLSVAEHNQHDQDDDDDGEDNDDEDDEGEQQDEYMEERTQFMLNAMFLQRPRSAAAA